MVRGSQRRCRAGRRRADRAAQTVLSERDLVYRRFEQRPAHRGAGRHSPASGGVRARLGKADEWRPVRGDFHAFLVGNELSWSTGCGVTARAPLPRHRGDARRRPGFERPAICMDNQVRRSGRSDASANHAAGGSTLAGVRAGLASQVPALPVARRNLGGRQPRVSGLARPASSVQFRFASASAHLGAERPGNRWLDIRRTDFRPSFFLDSPATAEPAYIEQVIRQFVARLR